MRILVLNCYSRNALAVINGLKGVATVIGADAKRSDLVINPDRWFRSGALESVHRYTDPVDGKTEFTNDLAEICRATKADGVVGTGTKITNFLSECKPELQKLVPGTKILVEDFSKLKRLSDKWNTVEVCRELGVPVPKSILLEDPALVEKQMAGFTFPVVVKPRDSYASKGVTTLSTKEEFLDYVRNSEAEIFHRWPEGKYIVQECISGDLHDVVGCFKEGRPYCLLTQQRMLSYYDFGGGGIVNKTTREQKLLDYAETILSHFSWNGIAMFDFVKHANGDFYLLECNPKVWGTTQLAIDAGQNVVSTLVRLFVLEESFEPKKDYKVGMVYKWILPDCVSAWIQKPLSLPNIFRRVISTFSRYGGTEVHWNTSWANMPHLLGIVFNRVSTKGIFGKFAFGSANRTRALSKA